ncbi:MAG: tyrosyl-tRNA synthetase [Chloroflexota bacterium]|nr:tyrosyl-tRNA synthetase [Chloroflexota bacterium]
MCGRRYHRVREGPFPPSGRGVDGLRPDPVTPAAVTPSFDPGLGGLIPELRWRGMFHAASEGLDARLATGRSITGYNGFDPSGPWLHIGHLVPIFGLIHLQRHGGVPIALVGGGTGMIGDPSGRSSERNLLSRERLAENVASMRPQLERFLDFDRPRGAQMANNLDWLEPIRLLDFLRDVGKHFTIPYMLAKDSVQLRLEGGLSFTEFSYMLIQSADFQHLYRSLGCELQMGGADQWGNITAGLELIRRTSGAPGVSGEGSGGQAFALSYPLLLTPSGAKFGKSESGDSVWLHADGTSPYAFYQHWLNTDDRDVPVYLRWFTLFDPAQIQALEAAMAEHPERREAQRALALDLTTRVHGADIAATAVGDSEIVFSGQRIVDPAVFARLARSMGSFPAAGIAGTAVASALASAKVVQSLGEARRLIQNGGLAINGQRVGDANDPMPDPIAGRWWEVRIGKRRLAIVELTEPAGT